MKLLKLLKMLKMLRLFRSKNLLSLFFAVALPMLGAVVAHAQEQTSEKANVREQNKDHSKELTLDLNKDSSKNLDRETAKDLNKDFNKGSPARQNVPRLRESDERFAAWMERVQRRQKMRELESLRVEQGLPPRPNVPARANDVRGGHLDLRSILQSPKREDVQQERVMRQDLKAQMERRRQEMQELRERRSQMSEEERRALRKQIRDASQGMPPPPRR
jgi:hypothetical protein